MNNRINGAVSYDVRRACLVRHRIPKHHFVLTTSMVLWLLAVFVFAGWAVPEANSQSRKPNAIDVDVPFEMRAPWFNRDRTAVEDEVTLRGTLHVSGRVWASRNTHIDRITFHINAVDIHGTSETTGQRFRVNGSYYLDQRDPDVPVNPDGTFIFPLGKIRLHLFKVDPEPAHIQSDLTLDEGHAAWATSTDPVQPPVPCSRAYLRDGTPTAFLDCGNFGLGYFGAPVPYADRVLASGGAACTGGPLTCEVPDGATLFNGFAGDYNPPLLLQARAWTGDSVMVNNITLRWHCKTGNWEAPVVTIGGGEYMRCSPLYSSTEPISVWAEVSYTALMRKSFGEYALQTFVVREAPHTFYMLERPGSVQIRSYDDKADFLAATGAVSATGPLPNLGMIADASDPSGSAAIGSVTFSLAPGGNNFFIGGLNIVPDWYPQTPENEIAMGYERLQVQTASPVFALGFEVIEPNTTMPSWGGTPVDSTYEVTLFSGTIEVGRFVFNVPDDVAPAFIGVWSNTAFDRIVIVDTSDSDDDEYFGEFFTGTTSLP